MLLQLRNDGTRFQRPTLSPQFFCNEALELKGYDTSLRQYQGAEYWQMAFLAMLAMVQVEQRWCMVGVSVSGSGLEGFIQQMHRCDGWRSWRCGRQCSRGGVVLNPGGVCAYPTHLSQT
eukprot:161024-Chlamydomonas_euryale.AAC.2